MSEDSATEVALLEAIENAARRSQNSAAAPNMVSEYGRAAQQFADALAIVRQGRAPFMPTQPDQPTTGRIYPR